MLLFSLGFTFYVSLAHYCVHRLYCVDLFSLVLADRNMLIVSRITGSLRPTVWLFGVQG